MFLFMSGYFCLGIHPVMLGHRGHFLHSSEDMPIHVILPTCPTHTHELCVYNTHTCTHRLGSRCAVLLAQSELPAEGRALPWQRAKKARWNRQRRGINAPLPYLLGNLHLRPLTTYSVTESRCRSNSLSRHNYWSQQTSSFQSCWNPALNPRSGKLSCMIIVYDKVVCGDGAVLLWISVFYGFKKGRSFNHELNEKLSMAQMNLIVHERKTKEGKPQGVALHISLQEDYGGFCTQTPLETKKEATENQI